MSLQFILGVAGSGKSQRLYEDICKKASIHTSERFFVLVPEQFTLETQKILVEKSEGKGIMNIDVLSFHRLAYRVFEERLACKKPILDDMGKMMVVRKVLSENKRKLKYFGKGIERPGFLDEIKSFLCELLLYRVDDEAMERIIFMAEHGSHMDYKLQDIRMIYKGFLKKLQNEYITAEEILPQLSSIVHKAKILKNSTICLDGFTGFTPCQVELLCELLKVSKKLMITLTIEKDARENLFELSHETIKQVTKLAREVNISIEQPLWVGKGKEKSSYRFKENGSLAFLEKNIFSYKQNIYEKEQDELYIYEAGNPKKEANSIVNEIQKLVVEKGYRYGDIAIVTGNISLYEDYLSSQMTRFGIRYFIDYKRNIGANAFSEFLLSFLEMVRKDFDYESTIRFLRCGLSPLNIEEVDCLENYVLALGKRGYQAYSVEWEVLYNKRRYMDMEQINQSRELFINSIEKARNRLIGGKKKVEDYVRILYDFIIDEKIYEKLLQKEAWFEEEGQVLLAKEYKKVYQVMMDLFDEMIELLGGELITLEDFIKLLGAGISEGLVGLIPPSIDQVVVGDVERSRLKDIKVLFIAGVNDGIIPKIGKSTGVLSLGERELLRKNQVKLAPTPKEQIFISQFYMYLNLTKASDRLYLSYFNMNFEGKSSRPSYLIRKVLTMFPKLKVHIAEDYSINGNVDCSMNTSLSSKLSELAVQSLYGDILKGSVSRLEQYAKCPFSHFINYGLGLMERLEYHIGMPDYGNVFHEALEKFSEELHLNGKKWSDIVEADNPISMEEQVDSLVEGCVRRVIGGYKGAMFAQSERTNYIVKRINRIMKRTVKTIAKQMREDKFEQKGYEISFSQIENYEETHLVLKDGKMMDLQGRIDRIDTYEKEDKIFVRVVDYKTGSTEFDITSLYYGLQMQLAVYLEAALALEKREGSDAIPAGMFYYRISDPVIELKKEMSNEDIENEIHKKLSLNGFKGNEQEITQVIQYTRRKMTEFGNEILEGNKHVLPTRLKKKEPCEYCKYGDICGFDPILPECSYNELENVESFEWEVPHEVDKRTKDSH